MFKIEIHRPNQDSETVYVYGENSLLNELEQRSVLVTHNCRAGHCGACSAVLKNGQINHQTSLYPLSNGEILLCQARPITDIVILLNV